MACPLAAAVYALIINVRGTKDPKTLENLLSATAHPNVFRKNGVSLPLLAPVLTVVVISVIGYGTLRFRIAVDVVLPILVGVAVSGWWDRRHRVRAIDLG